MYEAKGPRVNPHLNPRQVYTKAIPRVFKTRIEIFNEQRAIPLIVSRTSGTLSTSFEDPEILFTIIHPFLLSRKNSRRNFILTRLKLKQFSRNYIFK